MKNLGGKSIKKLLFSALTETTTTKPVTTTTKPETTTTKPVSRVTRYVADSSLDYGVRRTTYTSTEKVVTVGTKTSVSKVYRVSRTCGFQYVTKYHLNTLTGLVSRSTTIAFVQI